MTSSSCRPAVECYRRRRQTPVSSLPPTLCVGGPVINVKTSQTGSPVLVYLSTCLHRQSVWLTCACLPVYLFTSSVRLAHLCLFTCLLVYIVIRPGSPVLVYLSTCLHRQSDWLTCACLPVYLFTSSVGLAHLCSTFPIFNPAQRCKVGRLSNIKAGVEASMVAIRKRDDEVTGLLAYLHIITNQRHHCQLAAQDTVCFVSTSNNCKSSVCCGHKRVLTITLLMYSCRC